MGNKQSHENVETEIDEAEEEMEVSPPSELELRARQINPAEEDYPFENIVLEGGGSKGGAYCGVVRVLEEIGLYPQIKRVAGTSAGAITAALIAAGYDSYEIEKFMKNDISMNLMLDGSFPWRIAAYIPRLISGYGLSGASQFNQWMGEKLKEKAGSADVTFDQLYKISGKELCIVVTNVNNMVEEYCHPKTTPDMPVRLAVRMSMSIPGLFQIVTYKSAFHLSSDTYVDGGILCNYPIHCFDGWWLSMKPEDAFIRRMKDLDQLPITLSNENRFGRRSDKTLGIQVYSETETDTYRFYLEKRAPLHVKPDSVLSRREYDDFYEKVSI
ncbi:uncharacterized protein YqhO-like [Argopecten irradians]|uniref:uncharacterized protein YqhO-like n=1 Tax=Argopecten irradians TaxID=31199 RepID=UPI00372493B0